LGFDGKGKYINKKDIFILIKWGSIIIINRRETIIRFLLKLIKFFYFIDFTFNKKIF
jgi:hypothetical protein